MCSKERTRKNVNAQQRVQQNECTAKNAQQRMHNKECEGQQHMDNKECGCIATDAQQTMHCTKFTTNNLNAQQRMRNKDFTPKSAHQRMRNKECEGTAKNEQ